MKKLSHIAAFAATLLTLAGCKKSEPGPSQAAAGFQSLLPKQGSYHFTVRGTDGTLGTEQITVAPPYDTAGGKASVMTWVVASSATNTRVFANPAETVFQDVPPTMLDSLATVIRNTPGVISFDYGGWPIAEHMPNTAKPGDAITFTGGPIHLHWVMGSNNTQITGDDQVQYLPGTVVQSNVPVTTPAGTFSCSVWAFSKKVVFQAGPISRVQHATDTLWMAPGVPYVKSTELQDGAYYVTQLDRIQ